MKNWVIALVCKVFGHDEVGAKFNGMFCTVYECRRCGHERDPEVNWSQENSD